MRVEGDMPETGDQPNSPKPVRTWRPMVLWTAGILLAMGLFWIGARALRLYQTHRIVLRTGWSGGIGTVDSVIAELGGRESAVARLTEYARLPRKLQKNDEARLIAFIYLWHCGPAGLRAVLAAQDDDAGELREAAWKAGTVGTVAARPPQLARDLAQLLSDRSVTVRLRAAEAIWFAADAQEALPGLVSAAGDPSPGVRSQAIRTVGRILQDCGAVPAAQAREAVAALEAALADRDAEVRAAVAEALKKIREQVPAGR
jgi:hypothetical protein